ncbi:MAG: nuclear transport factor 2 family protein [Bacteroidota bacterium]
MTYSPNFSLLVALLFLLACQAPTPDGNEIKPAASTETTSSEAPAAPPTVGQQLAQQQLAAYNRRDIDAFLVPFSDSVRVYNNITEFGYQGKDKMREGYASFFNRLDTLHCEVVNRIVTPNTVIDHEKLFFQFPDQPAQQMEAIAIYKIAQDKIQEVYFVNP